MAERTSRLVADGLELRYDDHVVVEDLTMEIPAGSITAIVGPNACGKSTLLKALARLLDPARGAVHLDGNDIHRYPTKEVARRLGMLPQSPKAPDAITVVDLVSRGRFPHRKWYQQWSADNERAVTTALVATDTLDLAERPVDELSGGQRQRVWIAMALAQETEILLLDEPTTYLDLAHQIEVLDLLVDLNRDLGRTIVLVLHDLNQAARYADHLVAMRSGQIIAGGTPAEVVTAELVKALLGLDVAVVEDPLSGAPLVVPFSRHHAASLNGAGTVPPDALIRQRPTREARKR